MAYGLDTAEVKSVIEYALEGLEECKSSVMHIEARGILDENIQYLKEKNKKLDTFTRKDLREKVMPWLTIYTFEQGDWSVKFVFTANGKQVNPMLASLMHAECPNLVHPQKQEKPVASLATQLQELNLMPSTPMSSILRSLQSKTNASFVTESFVSIPENPETAIVSTTNTIEKETVKEPGMSNNLVVEKEDEKAIKTAKLFKQEKRRQNRATKLERYKHQAINESFISILQKKQTENGKSEFVFIPEKQIQATSKKVLDIPFNQVRSFLFYAQANLLNCIAFAELHNISDLSSYLTKELNFLRREHNKGKMSMYNIACCVPWTKYLYDKKMEEKFFDLIYDKMYTILMVEDLIKAKYLAPVSKEEKGVKVSGFRVKNIFDENTLLSQNRRKQLSSTQLQFYRKVLAKDKKIKSLSEKQ
ncbi:MAG TPA: hypothetical protein VEK38_01175 [Candidatus Bathyarchaeia archaeon]|nr:hypothetical protein [Candidatus Bathyarchaeia archaeon]